MKTNQRGKLILAAVALVAVATMIAFSGRAKDKDNNAGVIGLRAGLTGFQEVAPKNTVAHGTFRATISEDRSTISWTVTWEGLSGPPIQAHIHIGQKGVNGAVVVFFCGAAGNPPNTKGPCPQTTSATISGSFTAADIRQTDLTLSPPSVGQGFADGDLSDVIRYILAGDGYAQRPHRQVSWR